MKPSEMTDLELAQAWFMEAHGIKLNDSHIGSWKIHDSESYFNSWVLPVMGERGMVLWLTHENIRWLDADDMQPRGSSKIKNNRRLRAAVEGALEILRGEICQ